MKAMTEVIDRIGRICYFACVLRSLFSPCYLLLKKLSKSLILHSNCPFFRN